MVTTHTHTHTHTHTDTHLHFDVCQGHLLAGTCGQHLRGHSTAYHGTAVQSWYE
jgi:hypothetical protein